MPRNKAPSALTREVHLFRACQCHGVARRQLPHSDVTTQLHSGKIVKSEWQVPRAWLQLRSARSSPRQGSQRFAASETVTPALAPSQPLINGIAPPTYSLEPSWQAAGLEQAGFVDAGPSWASLPKSCRSDSRDSPVRVCGFPVQGWLAFQYRAVVQHDLGFAHKDAADALLLCNDRQLCAEIWFTVKTSHLKEPATKCQQRTTAQPQVLRRM